MAKCLLGRTRPTWISSSLLVLVLLLHFQPSSSISLMDYLIADDLIPLYETRDAAYYMSTIEADFETAGLKCKESGFQLLSIESDKENKLLKSNLRAHGADIDGIWTSGKNTANSPLTWSATNATITYKDFGVKAKAQMQTQRRTALNTQCSGGCGGGNCKPNPGPSIPIIVVPCDQKPNCNVTLPPCDTTTLPCTVTPPQCSCHRTECSADCPPCTVEPPVCHVIRDPCEVITGECTTSSPHCSVETPPCHTTRPPCVTTQKPCKPATSTPSSGCPNRCTTTPGPSCTPTPARCTTTQPPCTVTHSPCHNQTNPCRNGPCVKREKMSCTRRYPPGCMKGDPTCSPEITCDPPIIDCPGNGLCTELICPEVTHCPDPVTLCSPPQTTCKPFIDCSPVVCQSPALVCEAPTTHCPPPTTVCPPPIISCEEPEAICSPPEVKCPEAKVSCSKPLVVCPGPNVTCPGPVTTCEEARLHCPSPVVDCPNPIIDCEKPKPCPPVGTLPPVVQPTCPPGTDEIDYGSDSCISLERELGYKWDVQSPTLRKHFICEIAKDK